MDLVPAGASDLPPKVKKRSLSPEIKTFVRRFIALALVLALLSSGVSGCSQPIDTGSSVPAQSQPLVALLALVGLGIGLTAWHHHNEHRSGSGGGGGPSIVGAVISVAPFISGYKPVDLAPDPINGTIGALELPTTGGGTGKFTEMFASSASFDTYALPASYAPVAVSMDANGLTWFVDATGHVQGCGAMTQSTTVCSSIGTFVDGLGSGARSISVDTNIIVVVTDAGSGKVKWWAEQGSPAAVGTGTYTPSGSTSPIFSTDAVKLSTSPSSGFTVYHQDGTSDFITFAASGSSLTINVQPNFKFNPASLVALSNFQNETSKFAVYGFTGTATASYYLTKYETPGTVGLVSPVATSQLIDLNGTEGNPSAPFAPPLFSSHFDALENAVWALDQSGNIVGFNPF